MSSQPALDNPPASGQQLNSGMLASVTVHRGLRQDIVTVVGELDLATAPQLSPVIHRLLARGRNRITIDLARMTFVDVSALSALLTAQRDVRRLAGVLTVSHNPRLARLLALAGLETVFDA